MDKTPKIDRKTLRTPDEFVQKGRAVLGAMQQKRRVWLTLVVVVMGGAFAYYGYTQWQDSRTEANWEHYQTAMKEPVEGGKRWDALKTLYGGAARNRPAFFAALGLADHFYDEAKKNISAGTDAAPNVTQAVEWYTNAMGYSRLASTEKQLLHINRGGSHELGKKYDEALVDYKSASDLKGHGTALALLNSGRIYELKGDNPKAIEIYEKVSADHANSEYAKWAKNYVRRLKSPVFQPAASQDSTNQKPKK